MAQINLISGIRNLHPNKVSDRSEYMRLRVIEPQANVFELSLEQQLRLLILAY